MIALLAWPAVTTVALLATVWWTGGPGALAYAAVYAIAVAPGIPLGLVIFGRRHAAGWIAGALVGYGTTQLALWSALEAGIPTATGFLACWGLQAVVLIVASRYVASPAVALPEWTRRDTAALCVVLLLVPALMGPPYRNLGAADESGTKYYRAYFTADFVWHTALAAEIGKHAMPPRNPYLAPQPMHYYWAYFLLPAVVAHDGPAPLDDIQQALKVNAICSAILVLAALFLLARAAVPAAWPALVAVILGVTAASAEGAWFLLRVFRAGAPLAAVKDVNVDAITAWQFQGLRIDGLPRALWYNPQHSIACALGLLAMLIASTAGAAAGQRAIMTAGVMLGLSTMFNPFVGAVFSVIYAAAVFWQWAHNRDRLSRLAAHAAAAVPVALALLWSDANKVTSDAGSSVHIGFSGAATYAPVLTLLLSTGPMLLPAVAGLWDSYALNAQARRVAAAGVLLSLLLLYFLTLGNAAWVGFRAGQILLLMLPVLVGRLLWRLGGSPGRRWRAAAVALIILAAGLPTTAIDEYNAQDITNRGMGAGFRWTVTLSAQQQEALAWIREHTPEDAIVQMEPTVRGRDQWSLIPTFAERRMAAGLPISLQALPGYEARSADVRDMFATTDARHAWEIAMRLRIRYVYADATDRAAYPAGVRKFAASGGDFVPVFENAEAAVYRVRQPPR